MTDTNQFLETEAVLRALLDELSNLKSAADQVNTAGASAKQVTAATQQVVDRAAGVLQNSTRMLAHIEEAHLTDRLNAVKTALIQQRAFLQEWREGTIRDHGTVVQQLDLALSKIDELRLQLESIRTQLEDAEKRDNSLAAVIIDIRKVSRTSRISIVINVLLSVAILVWLVLSYFLPAMTR